MNNALLRFTIGLCVIVVVMLWADGHAQTLKVTPRATTITVTLNASPMTGTCPYDSNVSWNAVNASGCTKSGAWSGNVAASGSETVNVNATQMTLTLTCSAQTESALLQWTNPTQNVDGTAATLKGNKVFHSNLQSDLESKTPIILTPAVTQYLVTGLPAGIRYFGVKATSSVSPYQDSALAGPVSTTITLPSGADTKQLGCTTPPVPKPPSNVTVGSTVWDTVGGKVGRDVGLIALDVECLGTEPLILQGDFGYWRVPREEVDITRKPRSTVLLGRCEERPT